MWEGRGDSRTASHDLQNDDRRGWVYVNGTALNERCPKETIRTGRKLLVRHKSGPRRPELVKRAKSNHKHKVLSCIRPPREFTSLT